MVFFIKIVALLPRKLVFKKMFNSKYEMYLFLKKLGFKCPNLKFLPIVCCLVCVNLSFKIVDYMKSIKIIDGKVIYNGSC